jgi:hypothetical protein
MDIDSFFAPVFLEHLFGAFVSNVLYTYSPQMCSLYKLLETQMLHKQQSMV